jgi:hypothetical protein
MHHEISYLLILKCPFLVLGILDFLMPCEYRIWGSPSFRVKCAYGHFLQMFSLQDLKSSYLESVLPSCITYNWMVIFLFKDDESCVYLEFNYTLGRHFWSSNYEVQGSNPFKNSGCISHSGHHARLLTCTLQMGSSPVDLPILHSLHILVRVHKTSVNYWVLCLAPP